MDPKWARNLLDVVCKELALRKASKAVQPLGLAVALSAASLGCGADVYGAPFPDAEDSQEQTEDTSPADVLYGAPEDVVDEEYSAPDALYGAPDTDDESELPPDLYGVADVLDGD